MTHRKAAIFGGAALVFAVGLGAGGSVESLAGAASPSSPVVSTPPRPAGGALPVQPVGGGGCVIGLNCGCIPHRTCPTPHARPGTGATQHNAPAPQNP